MRSDVLEAPARGLVEALVHFPSLDQMWPIVARVVVDNVQPAAIATLDVDESCSTASPKLPTAASARVG
jgi:hypothetical protein